MMRYSPAASSIQSASGFIHAFHGIAAPVGLPVKNQSITSCPCGVIQCGTFG
ncbi:MAG: hypothetical protein BWY06_03195 [Candidatus Latescibacteria bacterium ADurb.Bin168]|nr:MAG: hypothetical protein BWY06_03195 [Candidatus Latescibacteria bacterium ADurb.Bin168]